MHKSFTEIFCIDFFLKCLVLAPFLKYIWFDGSFLFPLSSKLSNVFILITHLRSNGLIAPDWTLDLKTHSTGNVALNLVRAADVSQCVWNYPYQMIRK